MPLFADINKVPKDLLNDDYTSAVTLKCKKNAGPLAVTIETERSAGGALTSKVGTKFAVGGVNVDKVQLKADGSHVLETSMSPCTGCNVSFKGGKGADLGVEYKKGSMVATADLDLKGLSTLKSSVCMAATPAVNVGGSADYSLKESTVSKYSVGASYTKGSIFAGFTTSKFDSASSAVLYTVNSDLKVAMTASHASGNAVGGVTVGGAYKAPIGNIKAKYSGGIVSASLVKDIAPKVTATASASMSGADTSTLKYGFGVTM